MAYTAYLLTEAARAALLAHVPQKYPDLIAHHVTVQFGVPADHPPPPAAKVRVVGVADDGAAVQALVVTVDGRLHREDGMTYHITWSLDRAAGAKPVDSNRVIVDHGFERLPQGIDIPTEPGTFR